MDVVSEMRERLKQLDGRFKQLDLFLDAEFENLAEQLDRIEKLLKEK